MCDSRWDRMQRSHDRESIACTLRVCLYTKPRQGWIHPDLHFNGISFGMFGNH